MTAGVFSKELYGRECLSTERYYKYSFYDLYNARRIGSIFERVLHSKEVRTALSVIPFNLIASYSILDIGCGTGLITMEVAKKAEVIGVDVSLKSLKLCMQHAREENASVQLLAAEASHLPFRPSVFDYIVITQTYEHLPQPDKVLGEVHRILGSNGYVYLTTPYKYSPIWITSIRKRLSKQWRDRELETFHHTYTVKQLRTKLSAFKILKAFCGVFFSEVVMLLQKA